MINIMSVFLMSIQPFVMAPRPKLVPNLRPWGRVKHGLGFLNTPSPDSSLLSLPDS